MLNQLIKTSLLLTAIFSLGNCGFTGNSGDKETVNSAPAAATPKVVKPYELFQPKAAEFSKLPAKVQLTSQPYIKGKAVYYHRHTSLKDKSEKKMIAWVYQERTPFLSGVTAEKPEEVETVVLEKCDEISLGSYALGAGGKEKIPAFGWKCEITIVDKTIPAVIYRKTFQNKLEEFKIISGSGKEDRESPPSNEIGEFLKNLPQK
jgi:hypothetical protein